MDEPYSAHSMAIRNGEPAASSADEHTAALAIESNGKYYTYCSVVFVADDAVMTAAHCVSDAENFPFGDLFADSKIKVITGESSTAPEQNHVYRAEAISVYPKYRAASGTHDIALIWLDRDVDASQASILPVCTDHEQIRQWAEIGQRIVFYGYGLDDDDLDSYRQKTSGAIQSLCSMGMDVCEVVISNGETIQIPEGTAVHDIEKGGPCRGDSGGPVIVEDDGYRCILGVTSHGDSDCNLYSVTTTAVEHSDWLYEKLYPVEDDGCSVAGFDFKTPHNPVKIPVFLLLCLPFLGFVFRKHGNCQ